MEFKPKVHFVCRGNFHRSRIAEAYAKSLKGNDWEISSSGIDADAFPNRTLSAWAEEIGKKQGFDSFFSHHPLQTTEQMLNQQDIIVCLAKDIYSDLLERHLVTPGKCVVWNIKDRGDWRRSLTLTQKRHRTFMHIRRDMDRLVHDIESGSWVDIVSDDNEPLGYSLPISIANQNELWHRSCHAVITTPAKRILVQKRSKRIMVSPNLLDVSLGGHVDRGEAPATAVRREIHEEVGILAEHPKLIEVRRLNTYHPHYRLHTKRFVYCYHVTAREEEPDLVLQNAEVASATFITPQTLKKLLLLHRLPGMGRLNYPHAFYLRIISLIQQQQRSAS